ncbi:hypothetical protein [Nostoc sp.]|uniref:hypothetical protein n=1 Tax=Nostoc sp. TaxID=1180 RepID=UPI002FFB2EFF
MTNINQMSFKSICNRKVIVEELIDSELKGIVGGNIVLNFSSQINATSTDGTDATVQDSNQDIVNTKTNQRTRTRRRFSLINGVVQTIDSTVTSSI